MTKTQQQSPTTQHIPYLNSQSHRRNILPKALHIFKTQDYIGINALAKAPRHLQKKRGCL